ncbi:MAG: UDP-N-acetylglucosamine 2-epimerase (non-hydrolyzing) [Acidobacteria bacterium]|nr:UDP-N-acetylglucosamine 2-epimerase (non-hydrolyzing) [Acidobacteriota bacterium]
MDHRKKIVAIVGARPQFIKAAVVSRALRSEESLEEILVHTGQHYDFKMSGAFFEELEIRQPDHFLNVGSGMHGYQTGEIMKKLEPVLMSEEPALVLVYGDTNSTLAGALTAAKLNCPVAHVEAGLRSFNRRMPEEINRIVTDHLASLLFCPTSAACANLHAEGISDGIIMTGDVMYDVALHFGPSAERRSRILEKLNLLRGKYILATVHRAENTDDESRMRSIFRAFEFLSSEVRIVFPIHPRTRKMATHYGLDSLLRPLLVTDPLGFLDMMMLVRNAGVVCTDSGGIQKEAYFHRVGCVTLRDQTEWVETVDSGWNVLAGADSSDRIVRAVHQMLDANDQRRAIEEYGDGTASGRVVEAIRGFVLPG